MSKSKISLVGATLAAAVAGSASADVTVTFTDQTWGGFSLTNLSSIYGGFIGTLTGVSVNATLDASTAYTYADDLMIYVDALPLSTGGLLQVGGFSNFSAAQRLSWGSGSSSDPGTTVISSRTVNPIVFTGGPGDAIIYLGNGYGDANPPTNSGTWTGSITLIGVNAVPAPGALALLGAASLVGARRRRS